MVAPRANLAVGAADSIRNFVTAPVVAVPGMGSDCGSTMNMLRPPNAPQEEIPDRLAVIHIQPLRRRDERTDLTRRPELGDREKGIGGQTRERTRSHPKRR